ncbi:hypothetical protein I5Q19_20130 [Pseudomonas stutzeri]|uniref:WYL domain-containing protein n=1 Tax=Stutzerimonas stutzeri TaxID=316 RepID=UPI0018D9E82D|nr:hypothetical protein [Stutzerimonas stutzeri]MBH3356075.1 hypothetical protein [Stutzerimonas stutzeri]
MQDAVIFAALVAMSGWFAGTINPSAVGLAGRPRMRVFWLGLAFTLVLLTIGGMLDAKRGTDEVAAIFGLLGALVSIGWPVWAVVGLLRRRGKQEPAAARSGTRTLAPQRRTPDLTAKPGRAMRTGWSLGTVAFIYEDADGDITHRTVTIHSVDSTYLKGECHDRVAERTFRLDRIIGDVVNLETGEILRAKSLARHFA